MEGLRVLKRRGAAMVQLTCNCLNVKINLNETNLNANSSTDVPKDCYESDFFQLDLFEVQLSQCSIIEEHSCLVHKDEVKEWLVHRCMNCGLYTHAVSANSTRLLISLSLLNDPSSQQRLSQSSDFSTVFNIVLHNQNADIPSSLPFSEESSDAFQTLQTSISNIQQQLNTYLLQEESNMEERIRAFEEEQRAMFSELQTRVKNDKKKMISLLFNNMQPSLEDSKNSINGNRPVLRPTKSVPVESVSIHHQPHKQKRSETIPERPKSFRSYNQNDDSDAMFMLDDDDDERPFSQSDEEDTDDSLQFDDSRRSSSVNLNSVLSTSVPISVPVWKTRSPRKEELDEDRVRAPAMDKMAEQMQALAKSVHNNDITDVFGELPRPRLNTFTGITRPVRK